MADLDTPAKRASAVHVSCPWRRTLPFPTGTIDQAERQQNSYLYSGILAAAPTVIVEDLSQSGSWARRPWQHPPHHAQAAPASSPWSFALPSRKLLLGGAS